MNRRAYTLCAIAVFAVLALWSCARRSDDLANHPNPFDASNPNWHTTGKDLAPTLTASVDTMANGEALWYDYDFTAGTGTTAFSLTGQDSNGKYDTLTYAMFLSSAPLPQITGRRILQGSDTFCLASGLARGATYNYEALVYDTWHDTAKVLGTVRMPSATPPRPPDSVNAIGEANTVYLSWKPSPDSSATYGIYRSDSAAGYYRRLATTSDIYYLDVPSLQLLYYYKIGAGNQYGFSLSRTPVAGFAYDPSVSEPSNIQASSYSSYISVTWDYYGSGGSTISEFLIFRSTSPAGPYVFLASVPAKNSGYSDMVRTTSTYYYKVAAVTTSGHSSQMSDSYASAAISGLSAPSNLTATYQKYGSCVKLSWQSVAGASAYVIARYPYGYYVSGDTVILDTVATLTYSDSAPTDSVYYYIVAAYSASGYGAFCYPVTGQAFPSAQQFRIDTTNTTDRAMYLTWYSGIPTGAKGLRIWRSTNGTSFSPLGTVNPNSIYNYVDSFSLNHTTTYYYSASIYNDSTESRRCPSVNGMLKPRPVDSLRGAEGTSSVTLSWPHSPGASGYYVYRTSYSPSYGYYYSIIDTLKAGADTSFTDTKIAADSSYSYRVDAFNSMGASPGQYIANYGTVKIPQSAQNLAVRGRATDIMLSWYPPSSGSRPTGYRILRGTTSNMATATVIDSVADTVYYDTVPTTSTYYYTVQSFNAAGIGSGVSGGPYSGHRVAPLAPDSLWATQGTISNAIRVHWTRPVGADTFKVYRTSAYPLAFPTYLLTCTDTFVTDPILNDSLFLYAVASVNRLTGIGSMSAQAQGFRMPPGVPDTITDLTATGYSTEIDLSWSPPDSGYRFSGFRLYRKRSSDISFSLLDSLPSTQTSFVDTALARCPDNNLYYVKVFNIKGESAAKDTVAGCMP